MGTMVRGVAQGCLVLAAAFVGGPLLAVFVATIVVTINAQERRHGQRKR